MGIDRGKAVLILKTMAEVLPRGLQRESLESVADWIQENCYHEEIINMPREEREKLINKWMQEYLTEEWINMSIEQRRERAAFYLDGLMAKQDFDALDEPEQQAFIKNGGLIDMGIATDIYG